MIDMQAYGPGDWPGDWPGDDDDMSAHDPAQERTDEYLNTQDAAAGWTPGGDGDITPVINAIVRMLARLWASESNDSGAGELPADWMTADVPF